MKRWLMISIASLALGLAGCQVQTQSNAQSSQSVAQSSSQTAKDYLAGPKRRGLTVSEVTSLTNLPKPVKAQTAVSFTGESNTAMQVLTFATQAAANDARSYYVGQGLRVYTNRRILFTAQRTLGRDWFEKYQRAIFRQ